MKGECGKEGGEVRGKICEGGTQKKEKGDKV